MDSFISVDRILGSRRGFEFMQFGTREEAKRVMAMENGRYWGRKIKVNLACSGSESNMHSSSCSPSASSSRTLLVTREICAPSHVLLYNGIPKPNQRSFAKMVSFDSNRKEEAWSLKKWRFYRGVHGSVGGGGSKEVYAMWSDWIFEIQQRKLANNRILVECG